MKSLRWLVVPWLVGSTACYHYVPAVDAVYPRGTPLRAELDTLSSFELSAVTVRNIDRVEGEMVSRSDQQLILSATWLQAATGNGFAGQGWTVYIPAGNVRGLEQKRVSLWRSAALVGGIVGGTLLGWKAIGLGPNSGSSGGGPGQPK
jgi:hypothetical protein